MKIEKITVISPVALAEPGSDSKGWRRSVNLNGLLRAQLMLKSFCKGFDRAAVDRFVIVCPDEDQQPIREMVAEHVADRPVAVIGESEFFSLYGLPGAVSAGLSGWQLQQIIKLGFAKICPTDFYLTLDSDIVQIRSAGIGDLFPDGARALVGVETAADYDRMYCAEFAVHEKDAKRRYYESSQRILGYQRPPSRDGLFFSETPVLLHKSSVIQMLDHIEARHQKEIAAILSEHSGWTEYSLYFQFLEMTGGLEKVHLLGGCNAVLSLEKSVWQPRACYKSGRLYDRDHFTGNPLVREGPFIAVQSWIPAQDWLPARFGEAADFYRELENWLKLPTAGSSQQSPPLETTAAGPAPLDPEQFLRILTEVDPSSALYRRSREVLEGALEVGPPIPQATPRREPKFLTIGMTTHSDFDGCYFTIQAIRLYHPEILNDVEFLIIDNDPTGPCAKPLKALENWIPNYRYLPYRSRLGTAVRDLIFRDATGEFVLCIDCHVLFPAGALARLIEYCRSNPESRDLLQGPLISDALEPMATHFDPKWSQGMYGCWGMDDRANDIGAPPFEIQMQGLGVFGCRRQAWPGFNSRLAGFGGEEGYIHEKIRRAGGKNLCLPFLRWMHRFERPMGIPYRADWTDRVRNYLLIYDELKLDPAPVIEHFQDFVGKETGRVLVHAAQTELAGPFHFFDAIYCINLDHETDRWEEMQNRFRRLGIDRAVRRFSAARTPANHHVGCALSHRRIIAEAKQQQLNTVLVFEDDARFSSDAADVLKLSLKELEGRDWQLLYLGGYRDKASLHNIPGCQNLLIPGLISCTHAIAYHHSVYDAILESVPENAVDVALWARQHLAIDQFYTVSLNCAPFLTWPVIATQASILPEEERVFED